MYDGHARGMGPIGGHAPLKIARSAPSMTLPAAELDDVHVSLREFSQRDVGTLNSYLRLRAAADHKDHHAQAALLPLCSLA